MLEIELLVKKNLSTCCGCYACQSICPKNAITMISNIEGFLYPSVNHSKCINCGLCAKSCPSLAPIKNSNSPKAFAAINKDESVRLQSSSGGIFTAIAQKVIKEGGIVFGAKFAEDFSVVHGWTDSLDGLKAFQGSKYVQSVIGTSYIDCKAFLEQARTVLFTGTPCQIQGLKKYLLAPGNKQINPANLLTIDLICHGVPSNKIWQKYKSYRESLASSQVVKTAFRRKNDGWKQYSMSFTYANDIEYCTSFYKDAYFKIFLTNIALRRSCYNCPFRLLNRPGDITLADFWGIEKVCPELDDNKGTSLVILHSGRGQEVFNLIKDDCCVEPVNIQSALQHNTSMLASPKMPKARSKFYYDLDKLSFEKLYQKYTVPPLWYKAARYFYGCLKKLLRK